MVAALCLLPLAALAEGRGVVPLAPYLDVVPSLRATVDGVAGTFLFDTAGGISVITPAFASSIDCKPWGRITGFRMRGERVDTQRCDAAEVAIAHARRELPSIAVWDLQSLLPPGAPPLHGSLGLDAFAGSAITLDLAAGTLIVETDASLAARTANAVEVPFRIAREAQGLGRTPFVGVQGKRGLLWMELDSGSDAPLIVGRHVLDQLDLATGSDGKQTTTLSMAGGIRASANVVARDLIIDGNIGAPMLRRWVLTMDLVHERLWIAPARVP